MRGANLAPFRAIQLDFAAHVRHPSLNPAPPDVEPRRMRIYAELVYNNIERFLANTFPISARILAGAAWHARVRDFVHRHRSTSPFFQEIPQEFLEHVSEVGLRDTEPPFLLELMHYEWVEMALDLETAEFPDDVDREGDLFSEHPVVSPLAWSLAYRFPVHRISETSRPEAAPAEPTHLVVYRDRADRVRFMESNPATARLIDLLVGDDTLTGAGALEAIAAELPSLDRQAVLRHGRSTLERLRDCDIIAGVRRPMRG